MFFFLIGKYCADYQRIYIDLFDTSVDEFMKSPCFEMDGRTIKILRNLPKTVKFHEFSVTGLKITIKTGNESVKSDKKINENHLRRHFGHYGEILECRWTYAQETEALFSFS